MGLAVIYRYQGKSNLWDEPIVWEEGKPLPTYGELIERHQTRYRVAVITTQINQTGIIEYIVGLAPVDREADF